MLFLFLMKIVSNILLKHSTSGVKVVTWYIYFLPDFYMVHRPLNSTLLCARPIPFVRVLFVPVTSLIPRAANSATAVAPKGGSSGAAVRDQSRKSSFQAEQDNMYQNLIIYVILLPRPIG